MLDRLDRTAMNLRELLIPENSIASIGFISAIPRLKRPLPAHKHSIRVLEF